MGAIKSQRMFLVLLPLALFSSTSLVSGHGGVLWPPIWQDGHGRPIEELTDHVVYSEPKVRDPNSNRKVWSAKSWLTDQAYTGGWGDEFKGIGPVTNFRNPNARKFDQCNARCANTTQPWAAPGRAPSLGGGCGIFGGNPEGCPRNKDSRPPGSVCGQEAPAGRGKRGTSSFGTDARLFDFPQMMTTEWEIGSEQEVVWTSRGSHKGGYTYRLCKLPEEGRTGITEECFTKNVLQFANNITMLKSFQDLEKDWESFEQNDLREGTFPEGSVWRPVGKIMEDAMRKDLVLVPTSLLPGDYVLGWRWDGSGGNQVWVSCSSVRLVAPAAGRTVEDDDDDDYEDYYTDEDYAELEQAFEFTF